MKHEQLPDDSVKLTSEASFRRLGYKRQYGGQITYKDFIHLIPEAKELAELVIITEYALSYSQTADQRIQIIDISKQRTEDLLLDFVGDESNRETIARHDRFMTGLDTIDTSANYSPRRNVMSLIHDRESNEIFVNYIESDNFPEDF